MAKINKCNAKQSKTQIEIKWPHLHTKAGSTESAQVHTHTQLYVHSEKSGGTWQKQATRGQQKKRAGVSKKNGKQVTEIKCSSCAAF